MKEFVIVLSGPPGNQVFYPGSTISGTVICENSVPKKFRQIVIVLEGRADVSWAGTRQMHDIDGCVNRHSSSNVYVSMQTVLWDKTTHGNGETFPAGMQNFPFAFQLPQTNIPPSFFGQFGSIKYFLEASIFREGMLKSDAVINYPLSVANYVAIDNPELRAPVEIEKQKTLCCGFCVSAPIVMTARLPRKGYCIANDGIPLEVHIENGSFRPINRIRVKLEKQVVFTCGSSHRWHIEPVSEVQSTSISAHTSGYYRPDPITIQQTIPTSFFNCDLISVSYVLRIRAIISIHTDLEIEIPITFGNIRSTAHLPAIRHESVPSFLPPPMPTVPLPSAPDVEQRESIISTPPPYAPATTNPAYYHTNPRDSHLYYPQDYSHDTLSSQHSYYPPPPPPTTGVAPSAPEID